MAPYGLAMGYKTEQRMCSGCGGFGSWDKTEYVSNPNPGGRTTMPVTRRETCFTCGGLGTTKHSVYEPDPVSTGSVSKGVSCRLTQSPRSIWSPPDKSLSSEGHEDLKKARAKTVATIIAISSALALFFSTINEFPAVNQRGILSAFVFAVIYFTLSRPLRGLSVALAKLVEVAATIVRTLLKVALWLAAIAMALYLIKELR